MYSNTTCHDTKHTKNIVVLNAFESVAECSAKKRKENAHKSGEFFSAVKQKKKRKFFLIVENKGQV